MASVFYATREQVKAALDSKTTARDDAQVDRALGGATRSIEGLTHRRFYPATGTRYLDWPNHQYARSWRLWLDSNEVASVTTLTAGGTTIPAADYFLRRSDDLDEAPYTHIEIDLSSSSALSAGDTHQRSVAVTGVFIGCPVDEESVGSLAGSLAATLTATASVTWTTARIGVGDILRIDSERVIITGRSMVDSTQNLATPLTASASNVTVAVSDGTVFSVETVLLLDSERMLVVDIAGNNLTVKRAWDGTVLAAHTGSDIYTLTGIEIARGQLGTTLAAHNSATTIYRYQPPPLVRELAVAEAVNTLLQEVSGYARQVGSGPSQREMAGKGLEALREQVRVTFGRRARKRAI